MAQWPPNLPWSVKLLNFLSYFAKITHRPDGSVNRSLMRFMDWPISPSNKPVNGVISSDFTVDKPRDLYFRLYTPTAGTSLPVIFFIHGGGFAYNAPSSKPYDGFCRRLAHELSAFIISVNYRLSPEHRYPAQIEDCFDVLKFIDSTEIEEGFTKNADLKRFFIAGDSSGANLVHYLTVKASEYEFSRVKHIGNISIQPFFGGEERTESELRLTKALFINVDLTDWMWKSYLPEGSDRDHPAANVFGPNSDGVAGIKYPATIVFKGGYDPLQDRQKRYYEGLKKYGKEAYLVECENAFHTFYVFPEVTESSLLLKEVKNFMQKLCESIS
ncbi:probable carboxylesterase 18 isoform X1 [Euphorbia lathyris]|uniref:probable carboxylesterase 18 isoform X1 n=1 Tax=Euphorbia lathyris TaxID=212925 RepID=UPI003314054C